MADAEHPLPHIPPAPPKERPKQVRAHLSMFAAAFMKTLGVGIALTVLFLSIGVVTDMTQKSSCNIAVHTLHGELDTYGGPFSGTVDSGALVRVLQRDSEDVNIKAVILDVDSPGGSPVAGEEVANALDALPKPNVSVIRSVGASAAYWAAIGADRVFASRSSDVGSIGVIVSFPDESEKNKKDGVAYNEFASGKFKNIGTPTRPVTKEEKSILERDIQKVYEHFVAAVARFRNMEVATVKALADGSSLTGDSAKDAGLIDEIGSFDEAKRYLGERIDEEPVLCEPDAAPLF